MRFDLKLLSLLDASGELSASARQKLLEKVTQDPAVNADFADAHARFGVFGAMPLPEPSAAQRKSIPVTIKKAVRRELNQLEKRARRARLLRRCAVGTFALAAFVLAGFSLLRMERGSGERATSGSQVSANRPTHVVFGTSADDRWDDEVLAGSRGLLSNMADSFTGLTGMSSDDNAEDDSSAWPGSF